MSGRTAGIRLFLAAAERDMRQMYGDVAREMVRNDPVISDALRR